MIDLAKKRVVVTGGAGFLGSFVVELLRRNGCDHVFVPRSSEFDLRDRSAVVALYEQARPDVVIHLAAVVGGIGANRDNPARFFYDNLTMGVELIHQAWKHDIEKIVTVGTICAYPKHTPVPFREEALWDGYPEETNAPYGIAKKALLVQSQAYRAQYGLNAVYLLPVNLYGPHDDFDLESSHVIPALIRKMIEAREAGADEVVLWGDGSPTREFLHARDAADAILRATVRYDGADPVNVGSGQEIAIRDLAELIQRLTKFEGKLVWDTDKPNGQPRRCLAVDKAAAAFGFKARTDLEEGLKETIAWYEGRRETHPEGGVPEGEA